MTLLKSIPRPQPRSKDPSPGNQLMRLSYFFGIIFFITLCSTGIILYSKGYTLQPKSDGTISMAKTGWILVKSAPDGAKTYLDEVLKDPTNASIGNLKPKSYEVRIVKDGYHDWKKRVQVKEEFVTVIEALLIKKAPVISPLTLTGVVNPSVDGNNALIAFYGSSNNETSGLWIYSLSQSILNSGRANPRLLASGELFNKVKTIQWSPDSSQILVQTQNLDGITTTYYLFDINKSYSSPYTAVFNMEVILKSWEEASAKFKNETLAQMNIPEELKSQARIETSLFTKDNKKFLYQEQTANSFKYHVVDLTDPIPVGRSLDQVVYENKADDGEKVIWHTTNEHLLIIGKDYVKIIDVEGANNTTIITAEISDGIVLPEENGRSIIINTTFNKGSLPNLHNISFN